MDDLFTASAKVIAWKAPSRSLLASTSWATVCLAYAFTWALAAAEGIVTSHSDIGSGDSTLITILAAATFLVIVPPLTWRILNAYARVPFSLREVFVLQALVMLVPSLIYALVYAGTYFTQADIGVANVFEFSFGIYMLFAYQKVLSVMASISKSQASIVIIVPLIIDVVAVVGAMFLVLPGW